MYLNIIITNFWILLSGIKADVDNFQRLTNRSITFGDVKLIHQDINCHFCTCLVRCTEESNCIAAEINKINGVCKLLYNTVNTYGVIPSSESDTYITSEFILSGGCWNL